MKHLLTVCSSFPPFSHTLSHPLHCLSVPVFSPHFSQAKYFPPIPQTCHPWAVHQISPDIYSFLHHLTDPPIFTPVTMSLISPLVLTWPLPAHSLPDFLKLPHSSCFLFLASVFCFSVFCLNETWDTIPVIYKGAGPWCCVIVEVFVGIREGRHFTYAFFFCFGQLRPGSPVTLSSYPPFQKPIRSTWIKIPILDHLQLLKVRTLPHPLFPNHKKLPFYWGKKNKNKNSYFVLIQQSYSLLSVLYFYSFFPQHLLAILCY